MKTPAPGEAAGFHDASEPAAKDGGGWQPVAAPVVPLQVWGRTTNGFKCPVCRAAVHVDRRGEEFRIHCTKCSYVRLATGTAAKSKPGHDDAGSAQRTQP